ncbi:MAG: protein kinase [Symploca sp. SIO2E9]|nr:protein kinase [Symploca sp. SIO2E9]
MSWTPGQQLQSRPYVIESVLGSGGFGITYKVRHLEYNQYFVIKTPLDRLKHDPNYDKYLRGFQKEGEKLKRLCEKPHPHIVQVIDFFTEAENPCLVMEYIPGENLYQIVKQQGALTETQAVKVICQIGDALNFMHQAELVHRDATPLNIMMRTPEEAVLIDFGIAKGINPATSTQTDMAGNRTFAPYEQVGKGSRKKTVDVYSLAASLYYAVTGECATASLGRKLSNDKLIPPKKLNPNISDRINQVILKGMALEPEARPQSVGEWLGLLTSQDPFNQNLEEVDKNPGISQSLPTIAFFIILLVGILMGTSLLPQNLLKEDAPESASQELFRGNYSRLENFLKQKKWEEADQETYQVMLTVAGPKSQAQGRFDLVEWAQFSCPDFKEIDRLWSEASSGKLGFSVQNKILEESKNFIASYAKIGWMEELSVGYSWVVAWNYDPETKAVEYYPKYRPNFDNPPDGHLPAKLEWKTLSGQERRDLRFEAIYRCNLNL